VGDFLPASRLETPELVAVEDGAGGFVVTNLVTGSIVVGLHAGSFTGDSTEVRTTAPGASSKQAWIPASLVVYERKVTGPTSSESRADEFALADGVSVAAIASELRATEPSSVDVRALIERVKKKP